MKKAVSILIVIALYGAAYLPTSQAQDLGGALDLPMLGQSLALSASIRAQAERDAERLRRRTHRGKTPQVRTRISKGISRKASTRFRTNLTVRRRNLAQFVAKARQADPQGGARLGQSFAQNDPIVTIARGLRPYNLRTDDVADAATAYLVSAWYGVRGRNDDPPHSYVNGVRQQMRSVMLSTPAFLSSSDATKQQMAEAMLVQLMVIDALITSAKGNPAQMAKAKAIIGQGARSSFQLDLTKLNLSNRGFKLQ